MRLSHLREGRARVGTLTGFACGVEMLITLHNYGVGNFGITRKRLGTFYYMVLAMGWEFRLSIFALGWEC